MFVRLFEFESYFCSVNYSVLVKLFGSWICFVLLIRFVFELKFVMRFVLMMASDFAMCFVSCMHIYISFVNRLYLAFHSGSLFLCRVTGDEDALELSADVTLAPAS